MSFFSQAHVATCLVIAAMTFPAGAQTPDRAARSLAATCFTCHGTDGRSAGGVPPSLAGRDKAELLRQMKDYKSGKRPSTVMQQHARGYTDEQLEQIAAYFATVPAKAGY